MSQLFQQLNEYKSGFRSSNAPEVVTLLDKKMADLEKKGVASRSLSTGQTVREFVLPDVNSNLFSLNNALSDGPLVISFYRGAWCPYCNLELKSSSICFARD